MTTSVDALERGRIALAEARWPDAREAFTDAIAAEATPEAYEGLSWAAWWQNDAPAIFEAREAAFRLYRERGDRIPAARMATWIACDYHDFRAEHAIANGWRQRARRLLEGLDPTPEHAWHTFQEGAYALELMDDTDTAKERAAMAAEIARAIGSEEYEVLALALEGLALVTEGNVREGMMRLDEAAAVVTGSEMRERLARTWTLCYLIYACERVRDLDRASQWCKKMAEVSEHLVFDLGAGVCRAHYGSVLMLRGSWEDAEKQFTQAAGTLAAARPPAVAEPDARLGELRRRQGRYEEAAELFARANPHPIAVIGRAALAIDGGDPAPAVDALRSLLAVIPASSRTQRIDALEVLARALLAEGDLEAAARAAQELRVIADEIGTEPMRAIAAATSGHVAAASGDAEEARIRFEEAIDLFARDGLPYEAAEARLGLAGALLALGRGQAAATHAETAGKAFRALGAIPAAARADALTDPPATGGDRPGGLTARELQVLRLVAQGLSDRKIGEQLFISPHTVHRHVSSILMKLGSPTRAAAAAHAGKLGLL